MKHLLISDNASFTINTPYKLTETGEPGEKPLIVYLHGFNQNIKGFQKKTGQLLDLRAYHLFIQAPYPVYRHRSKKKVEDWGRSWYWYDGDQGQFVKSLGLASQFIQKVIDHILEQVLVNRVAIFGYSMGGYLSGYFGLSRPGQVNELIVIGGRIKTEVFEGNEVNYEHLNVLALHGSQDERVKSAPQKRSCEQLRQWKASVSFKEVDAGHRLSDSYIAETKKWLLSRGYK